MVKKKVLQTPFFEPRMLSFSMRRAALFPLEKESFFYFGYGRVALCEGLKLLGISKGDCIFIPRYICNVVLAPLHELGIRAVFYECDQNLVPRWDLLEKQYSGDIKALLLVNYFGFPNDFLKTREFCKVHNLYFIEDNAHGFLSCFKDQPLGSFGDISIFSFSKTISIPHAAGLMINDENLFLKIVSNQYLTGNENSFVFFLKDFVKRFLLKRKCLVLESTPEDIAQEFALEKQKVSCPEISRMILRHLKVQKIKQERLKMYYSWIDFLRAYSKNEVKLIFPEIPEGVVPYACPVRVNKRNDFIQEMWAHGVEAFPWPFLPRGVSDTLAQEVACLPVFPFRDLRRQF